MKRLLALLMLGALLIPAAMAYYPVPDGETPEFAKSINGEWSDLAHPVTLEGLHYCETVEVTIWALWFTDLYAYDFVFTWAYSDPTVEYLTLVEAEVKHIHSADFVIIGGEDGIDNAAHTYHQAVTAIAPAEGWGDGKSMIAIANLYFHIDNDAQWPEDVMITFCFEDTEASDSCTTPIDHTTQEAYLLLEPCQPTISMLPPVIYKSVVGETFEVQFQIECAVKMKSFHFMVTWDPVQLKTDAQNVWIKDFLPPPYEYTSIQIGEGILYIDVQIPCEKPLRNGTGELFGIRFTALNPWPDDIPPYEVYMDDIPHPIWYPIPCWNYINIAGYIDKDVDGMTYQYLGDPAGVTVKGPDPFDLDADEDTKFIYDYPCDQGGFIVGYYEFRPIPGDLNLDGHVDVEDLSAVAKAYGLADTMDINGDGIVDIYDVVIVAKNFCRTEPDPDLPWPIFDP